MSNTLKDARLDSSWDALFDSQQEKGWDWQHCLTKPLAQDQRIFKLMEAGQMVTYSALRRDTAEDAQSNAGPKLPNAQSTALSNVLRQAWRSKIASVLKTIEESLETESTLVAEPQSCEAALHDQAGIIDDIVEDWTSDHLADELLELNAEDNRPRLREMILAAEDCDFTTAQSEHLAPRLLHLASQFRDSNDPQDAPAVFSAIRTGASMLRPIEAARLLALLEPGKSIDTSLVTLKMIGRIFEAQPPQELDQHTDLADEVRGIAELLLNRYAIVSSQSAAMAQLAVYALAAMASNQTLDMVRDVRRMDVSWFTQQAGRELGELRSYWDGRSAPVATEVLELLERATQVLRTT